MAPARPMAGQRSGQSQVVEVVAGRLGQRTRLTPSRHAAVDEPRIALERQLRPEAEPLHRARPKSFDQAVGFADEIGGKRKPLRALDDRPLPTGASAPANRSASACRRQARSASTRSSRMTLAPRSANSIAAIGAGPIPRTRLCENRQAVPFVGTLAHGCLHAKPFLFFIGIRAATLAKDGREERAHIFLSTGNHR